MNFVKRFLEWIKLKEKLHESEYKIPLFKEGEVWWCALGENVGIEMNGKSKDFTRPVLIFKKLSREGFLGIPMSTKLKEGTWYVHVKQKNNPAVVFNFVFLYVILDSRWHLKIKKAK